MKSTIFTIGNGGYNIAADCIEAGIFSDYKLIVCDSDAEDLSRNSVSADCSFLLDCSIEVLFPKDNPLIKPIVDEVTDRIYIFAALGGKVTEIYLPLIVMATGKLGRFIWNVISMPAEYEGPEVMRRAKTARLGLLAFTDMFLVQDNNKLSSIPGLPVGALNEPTVNTLAIVSLFDIQKSIRYTESYTEYIPEKYRAAISLYRSKFKYSTEDC